MSESVLIVCKLFPQPGSQGSIMCVISNEAGLIDLAANTTASVTSCRHSISHDPTNHASRRLIVTHDVTLMMTIIDVVSQLIDINVLVVLVRRL